MESPLWYTISMKELVVSAGVLICQGKFLIARRPPGDDLEGLWEFPGGKVEMGETPEQALVREFQEELGIVIETGEYLGFNLIPQPKRIIRLEVFQCTLVSGDPIPHFHDALAWVTLEQSRDYPIAPGDVPFLNKISLV